MAEQRKAVFEDREIRILTPAGDGPHAVVAGGQDVVLLRAAGGWRAYQGRCPHQGALLGEGELDGGELVCRNHRWRFDATTGERRGGPGCLRACPVREDGAELVLEPAALASAAPVAATARRTIQDLPGPRPLPILGSAHKVKVEHLHEILEAWAREFGPLYRVRFGSRWVVVSSDPDINERVLRARRRTSARRLRRRERALTVPQQRPADRRTRRPPRRDSR